MLARPGSAHRSRLPASGGTVMPGAAGHGRVRALARGPIATSRPWIWHGPGKRSPHGRLDPEGAVRPATGGGTRGGRPPPDLRVVAVGRCRSEIVAPATPGNRSGGDPRASRPPGGKRPGRGGRRSLGIPVMARWGRPPPRWGTQRDRWPFALPSHRNLGASVPLRETPSVRRCAREGSPSSKPTKSIPGSARGRESPEIREDPHGGRAQPPDPERRRGRPLRRRRRLRRAFFFSSSTPSESRARASSRRSSQLL